MSTEDTSEMDFLESELSILNISEEIQDVSLNPIFQDYTNSHPDLILQDIIDADRLLIVLSPLSAKHSFERGWVSKKELASIVERPQRLLACSIGISALFSLHPSFFRILKCNKTSSLSSAHVVKVHGLKWVLSLTLLCQESEAKLAKNELEVPSEWPTGDIYLGPDTIEALEGVLGSIEVAIDEIYLKGLTKAMIVVRPPGHHSHPCSPSGFCLLNNAQITIQYAYERQKITHAVILDIDLHHGDGSQDICWKRGGWKIDDDDDDDPTFDDYLKKTPIDGPKVGYFSLHDINSFPTELGMAYSDTIKNASTCILSHDVTIWNVHLEQYQTLKEYEQLYESKYREIITKLLQFLTKSQLENPDNFKPLILISAGFDASEYETVKMQRHQVNLPTSFYHKFTNDVCETFLTHFPTSTTNTKIVSILEGGYSNEALCSGIFSHLMGFQNLKWDTPYGSKDTVKELVKGCKPNWKPSLKHVNSWHQDVIELGRELLSEAIIIDPNHSFTNTNILENNENILERLRSHKNGDV